MKEKKKVLVHIIHQYLCYITNPNLCGYPCDVIECIARERW